jgi:single-strand DNA-binding protein
MGANFNINKSIIGGRLTADPELKQTTSGLSVCSFTVAVNRRTGKDKEDQTDFINCQAWRQTAEFICKYFKKGSSICIAGAIQTRNWTDNNGQKRYATEVIADEAYFVDGKNDAQGAENTNTGKYMPAAYTTPQQPEFEPMTGDGDLPF